MKQDKFLSQSYSDAWNDYEYSLRSDKAQVWDWVVITASNQRQANAYQVQIDKRMQEGRLPKGTKFRVIPDLDGKRIGSGGATLNALKKIAEEIGIAQLGQQKVLMMHSGGDSKRIPQYSACGKLFAPVPRMMPNGIRATIFDELMIAVSGVPGRVNAGMLVLPSDTEILYNPLQLDLLSCDAAGLSIKASVQEGTEHGVFVSEDGKMVSRFLHKQSESTLRKAGAVDDNGNIDIDTGCIWVGHKVVDALLSLVSVDGALDEALFRKFVNPKVCLSFYADFVFPLAEKVTLEEYYKETPEGVFSDDLLACRKEIWEALHGYQLSLIRMNPARYIHFGMTHEMYELFVRDIDNYEYLGWKKQNLYNVSTKTQAAINNGYISPDAVLPADSYVEDSIIGAGCRLGNGTVVSGIQAEQITVPDEVVLHGLKLSNGRFVCRIYGREDNPKSSMTGMFLGTNLNRIIRTTGIANEDVWDEVPASIWNAKIYLECETMGAAVDAALKLYDVARGKVDNTFVDVWKQGRRYSLKESFNCAESKDILEWQEKVEHFVRAENCIYGLQTSEQKVALAELSIGKGIEDEVNYLYEQIEKHAFPMNMRIALALSQISKERKMLIQGKDSAQLEDMAYGIISDGIIDAMKEKHEINMDTCKFVKDEQIVELPVRVNFCGSPSDAAPYCLEHGGTMVDGALLLKGKLPIVATVRRLDEKCVILESADLQAHQKFTDIRDIRNCGNPFDTFALHKAVLVAAGVIPLDCENVTLEEICDKIGGGLYMSTAVDVPKGSGLGTSSIVAAACLKAVNMILNQDTSDDCIYAQVFAVEQLMTTGGGWQDQAGGLTYGMKLMKTQSGMYQKIDIEYLDLPEETMKELKDRFVLIFSGQRRLARNVLREETNQCIRNDKTSMAAIERIREICVLMKYQLERGNVTEFAHYITEQFELVKTLDKGASNTCIEYIFDVCDDLIDGKAICGAGGGGFLQAVLKKGVTKEQLRERINKEFMGCGVEVWDCELI